jgi:spermidine/putrescine transport system ATP-binding protein
VEQVGLPEELYEAPATRFVAGFIGVSNFISGSLESTAGGGGVMKLGEGQRVIVGVPGDLALGSKVSLSVRPEKIQLLEMHDKVPDGNCLLFGTVRDVVYLGMTTQYRLDVPAVDKQFTVLEQNVKVASEQTLWEPGERAQLTWHPLHNRVLPHKAETRKGEEGV